MNKQLITIKLLNESYYRIDDYKYRLQSCELSVEEQLVTQAYLDEEYAFVERLLRL